MNTTRILLAEDHAILREGVKSLLAELPGLEIAGEAEDGREAVELARQLQPDLILMDLSMPHLNGIEAIKQVKRQDPHVRILVMTVHNSDEYLRAALEAGADGYVLKEESHLELLNAIRNVVTGGTHVSSRLCGRVVNGYLGRSTAQQTGGVGDTLTDREREVLKLVAEGRRNRDIALALSVSVKTVEKHRANVMRKLDVHTAAGLTAYAIDHGLLAR